MACSERARARQTDWTDRQTDKQDRQVDMLRQTDRNTGIFAETETATTT